MTSSGSIFTSKKFYLHTLVDTIIIKLNETSFYSIATCWMLIKIIFQVIAIWEKYFYQINDFFYLASCGNCLLHSVKKEPLHKATVFWFNCFHICHSLKLSILVEDDKWNEFENLSLILSYKEWNMNDREHSLGIHFFAFFSLCVIYYVKFIKNCELLDNSYVCTYCTSCTVAWWVLVECL